MVTLTTRASVGRTGCVPARPFVLARRSRTRVELGAVVAPEPGRACAHVRIARHIATGSAVDARLHDACVEVLATVAVVTSRTRAFVAGICGKKRTRAGQACVVGAGWIQTQYYDIRQMVDSSTMSHVRYEVQLFNCISGKKSAHWCI